MPHTDDDVCALLAARYRLPERDAARLGAFLAAHAEGNPFYLGEFLRTLVETGVLRPRADG